MALTTAERDAVYRAFMRTVTTEPTPYVKAVLRAAVDNCDDWADANATSYNTSLTAQFRNNATAAQKATLLALVAWARAGRPLPEGQ